jgi:hypothetical protein
MAGDEDETQKVIAQMIVGGRLHRGGALFLASLESSGDLLVLALLHLPAPDPIDAASLGRGHQPGAGIVGDARSGPRL